MVKTSGDKSGNYKYDGGYERNEYRMTMGRSTGDGKTNVVEESAIGDDSAGGPMSVCGRCV